MSKVKRFIENVYIGDGWWNLRPFWNRLKKLGEQRDSQKRFYRSTKNWSANSTHFLGLLSEMAFSLETGIMLDTILKPEGDSGFDFEYDGKQFDIKGTRYYHDPHLKQYPNPKQWCDYYLLAGIDVGDRKVKVFGWASCEELQSAKLVNYGHGNQRSIPYDQLHKGMPDWLPSLRNRFEIPA